MPSTLYRIVPIDPRSHLFEVSCTVTRPNPGGQAFRLPAWIPGSYLIREFSRQFVVVRASANGQTIAVTKSAKDLWQVASCEDPVTLTAQVYAYDVSVRAAYLDSTRGYFNGPSVFVWPAGHEHEPCEVEIVAPHDAACRGWRVATTLSSAGAAPYDFGRYHAANYDELIDHPVEMGTFALGHFEAGGAHHDVAITGGGRGDVRRLERDLARVCQAHIDFFGGTAGARAPFDRYLFLVLALGEGHGGLEHRNSTSLICRREELPQLGVQAMGDEYRSFLGLASHEYFHAWNVKRIKPEAFTPYDLTRENYTRQLWAFEGITSHYDDRALLRSGVIGVADYLELLGRDITALLRTPARARQSVAESSFDAWIKYYRQDENAPNAVVSYYVKGALVALALDLTLRFSTTMSLDDVMRGLWQRYGRVGIGVPEDGVAAMAQELSKLDLHAFFDDYVHGTSELPLDELLGTVGIELHLRSAEGGQDKGGSARKDAGKSRLWIGAVVSGGAELRLKHVLANGPAANAGLAAGDIIVAIDGIRASAEGLTRVLESRLASETINVHAFRRDELMSFPVALEAAPLDTCWLTLSEAASAEVRLRRDAWLGLASRL